MVASTSTRKGRAKGALVVDLAHRQEDGAAFTRADLVFSGVDHSGPSYEVRIFLNNTRAGADTPRVPEEGYAGRFEVFGHGGCYGDEGHCDVPPPSSDPTDLRPPHSLTPLSTYVTITDALKRLLSGGGELETVTLVPLSVVPRRRDRGPAPELFTFSDVELHTYLPAVEDDAAE
jgi:tyrosinase